VEIDIANFHLALLEWANDGLFNVRLFTLSQLY